MDLNMRDMPSCPRMRKSFAEKNYALADQYATIKPIYCAQWP